MKAKSFAPEHRILVTSHGHPDFSLGGGEIAAYDQFNAYRARPDVAKTWFLARHQGSSDWPSGNIGVRRADEFLWDQAVHDWHMHRSVHRESLRTGFAELMRRLNPSMVHAHHYAHMGLDYLVAIHNILPQTRIYLTLHEYMAICRHNGQMVKTGTMQLCKSASPLDCHRCFPDSTPEDFWLRQEFIQKRLELVDGFIAPSQFLKNRYVAWGLPEERIAVIENGQPDHPVLAPRPLLEGERRNRFAYFGQVNAYKGLDVVLKALNLMRSSERKSLVLEVHAAYLERQPLELRERIAGLLEPLAKSGVVQWVGPYRPEDMRKRLAGVDWVLVPSIWWENSPLVIQEAYGAGRPVIGSDIGGMAEKITDEKDGLHVPVGNAIEWSRTLLRAANDPDLWGQLASNIRPVLTHENCAQAHLDAFDTFSRLPPR